MGVGWDFSRADNDSFIPAARHLARHGVAVPGILEYRAVQDERGRPSGGLALIEDMGDEDLLSRSGLPWEERRPYYIKALVEADKLHGAPAPDHLQPPFDAELYGWEQAYFAEHYLGSHCGRADWREFSRRPVMRELASRLASLPRRLVHRDFQSQNIMIRGGEVWLIDFQGMRLGLPEYDIASLLYDPYAGLSGGEREELLAVWERIRGAALDRDLFFACACQRLMQALGAYANLWHNRKMEWYRDRIPVTVRALSEVLAITELVEPQEISVI